MLFGDDDLTFGIFEVGRGGGGSPMCGLSSCACVRGATFSILRGLSVCLSVCLSARLSQQQPVRLCECERCCVCAALVLVLVFAKCYYSTTIEQTHTGNDHEEGKRMKRALTLVAGNCKLNLD
jgi:hypothetical protein